MAYVNDRRLHEGSALCRCLPHRLHSSQERRTCLRNCNPAVRGSQWLQEVPNWNRGNSLKEAGEHDPLIDKGSGTARVAQRMFFQIDPFDYVRWGHGALIVITVGQIERVSDLVDCLL